MPAYNYKDAGVDVKAGYEAVRLMEKHVKKTFRPEILTGIGGFGGLFALDMGKYSNPILVSGTDGVGTKLKLAFMTDKHDTIGIDCVAMCVNDIVCCGAEPLFFLDYIAVGKNIPGKIEQIVKGISEGCIMSGCSLIGGETAEMPGFYGENEYDMAGFAVGIVEKSRLIDGSNIKEGDKLIGLASSGLHSNGFSLVRKLINPDAGKLGEISGCLGTTLGEELLRPTKIYVKMITDLVDKFEIKGIANITGGGFIENIPRMLPKGIGCKINKGTWPVLPVFKLLEETGNLTEEVLFNTFNMGIGMVAAVNGDIAGQVVEYLKQKGELSYIIGETAKSDTGVEIC